jgi:hypothetical protein
VFPFCKRGPYIATSSTTVDLVVFENSWFIGGDADGIYAEPGEINVSEDGAQQTSFPARTPRRVRRTGPWRPVY